MHPQREIARTSPDGASSRYGPRPARERNRDAVAGENATAAVEVAQHGASGVDRHQLVLHAQERRSPGIGGPGDGGPARGHGGEQGLRAALLGCHPGGRRAGREAVLGPVEVAPADQHRVLPPPRPEGPGRGRGEVEEPGDVPELEGCRKLSERVLPAHVAVERMVDAEQASACRRLLYPEVGRAAKIDEADVAVRVGVAAGCGHLLPGKQCDVVPGGRRAQVRMVRDGVVIGDGEKVEATHHRAGGELIEGQRPVGVGGMGMHITGEPGQPVRRRKVAATGSSGTVQHGRGWFGLDARVGRHRDRHRHRDGIDGQPAETQLHAPLTRLELSGDIARRRSVGADHETVAPASRPAPPASRTLATQVDQRRRPVVAQLHLQALGPCGHQERFGAVLAGQLVLEPETQSADLARHPVSSAGQAPG